MTPFKNLFKKSSPKLNLLGLEQKIDFAFDVFYQFTPLVEQGIEDIKELKHSKETIKNSALFIFRELRREPGMTYILNNHLVLDTKEKYDQYINYLVVILSYLAKFTENKSPDLKKYFGHFDKYATSDISKDFEASISNDKERMEEYKFYLSELDSIETDLKNNTSFKKIRYFDFE